MENQKVKLLERGKKGHPSPSKASGSNQFLGGGEEGELSWPLPATVGLLDPQLFLLNFSPYRDVMHGVEPTQCSCLAYLWGRKASEFQMLGEVDR